MSFMEIMWTSYSQQLRGIVALSMVNVEESSTLPPHQQQAPNGEGIKRAHA